MDHAQILHQLCELLDDDSLSFQESIQSLWSGYGQILRVLSRDKNTSYVIKVVAPPTEVNHPRGWASDVGHQRKLKSYQVERVFYQQIASTLSERARVPKLIAFCQVQQQVFLVLEDLDTLDFDVRIEKQQGPALNLALNWLANFHAQTWQVSNSGVWPTGSYWHLSTRQDEWLNMPESRLKLQAKNIDQYLRNARFQPLIHGDAKFANFCFHSNGNDLAAVDFQYVGYGSPVKDIAYLVAGCLTDEQLFNQDKQIIERYLTYLAEAFVLNNVTLDFEVVAAEIRALYCFGWADFYRFLVGWNPQSAKISHYMQVQTEHCLNVLENS